jgi:signal transduction histidine kinase
MGTMTKLLNKPLKTFAIYSLIILVISIPVYVFVVDYIWIDELDDNNWFTLQYTKQKLQSKDFTSDEIEQLNYIWGELHPGLSISKVEGNRIPQDSVYEAMRTNKYLLNDRKDRFRGLKSYVEINGQPYQLTIETNVEESDETFVAIAVITLLFFIILILGFILLNRRIAAKTWKPFYHTLHSLQSFELSRDSVLNLPSTDIREFQKLNQSLELLVKNNVDTYQQQKSFTENASHELQTPIALLRSKIDLLFQEKDITPQILEILNGIEAPLLRLSRINKNLLLLAKIENYQYNEKEQLDVKRCIESSLTLFEDYINDKNLIINNSIKNTIIISANSYLLETLINNFLSNAIRHTISGGHISIKLEGRKLFFGNSGITALKTRHLFERFSTTSKDKVSSGLGLAIIKEIANKYNWKISYCFENGDHTFTVAF